MQLRDYRSILHKLYVVGRKEKVEEAKLQITTALELLSRTKIENYEPPLHTIYVESTDSLATAFNRLIKHRILSVPVYDRKSRRFNKFVDLLDFVAYIGNHYNTKAHSFREVVESEFPNLAVSVIADASQRNLWYPVQNNASLRDAIERMVKYNIHRIPVFDYDQVTHILTQADMVAFIHEHINYFSNIREKTIEELQLAYKNVVCIQTTETAMNGFLLIHSMRVSGVAVVNKHGSLVGNLSASDLKNLVGEDACVHWEKLSLPVSEYLNLSDPLVEQRVQAGCIEPTATFQQAIATLVQMRFHRVYVIDSLSRRPIGVISQVDALSVVLTSLLMGLIFLNWLSESSELTNVVK